MERDKTLSDERRDFMKKGLALLGLCPATVAAVSGLVSCEFDREKNQGLTGGMVEFDTNPEETLTRIGGSVIQRWTHVNFGIPIIIVRIADDAFACFSSLCTHANCFGDDLRLPRPGRTDIVCYCHGSRFDPFDHGNPIKGPAEKALKEFPSKFDAATGLLEIYF